MSYSIFEAGVLDCNIQGYQGLVAPDLFPEVRPPVLKNWNLEDLVAYCGGEYAKMYYPKGNTNHVVR